MKRSAPFDTAFGPSKITPRPEWAECLLRGSFGTAFGPILGTLIGSRFRPHSTPHSTHGGKYQYRWLTISKFPIAVDAINEGYCG